MRQILRHRGMRLVFLANLVSMLGSGMNAAAVFWHVLQATHSEIFLGKLLVLQTAPALLLLPFAGVVIDREDRRHLLMLLDFARGAVVLTVAVLALRGEVRLWHLYVMNTLVAAGFWMFWPTINALIHELTPGADYVSSNTLLLAAVQGGFLLAGAIVGFLYDHIGLGWILVIDFSTYVVSFALYFGVRRGRVVHRGEHDPAQAARSAVQKYVHELREGLLYVRERPRLMLLGTSWALFIGAMLTQGAVTAPLSARILHGGAVGYGWLNGAWGTGAFLSVLYSPWLIAKLKPRRSAGLSLALLAAALFAIPYSRWLAVAVLLYVVSGSGRGVAGTAIASEVMEIVPKHFMGRVQNSFYMLGMVLQVGLSMGVAAVAHRVSLTLAFAMIAGVYMFGCLASVWPSPPVLEAETETLTAVRGPELAQPQPGAS